LASSKNDSPNQILSQNQSRLLNPSLNLKRNPFPSPTLLLIQSQALVMRQRPSLSRVRPKNPVLSRSRLFLQKNQQRCRLQRVHQQTLLRLPKHPLSSNCEK
jgi:type II secretory pathway component HofQ